MTPKKQPRATHDPDRHDDRLRVLNIHILQLRAFELEQSFRRSIGTASGHQIEELLHYKIRSDKWIPSCRSKLPDRQMAGVTGIGTRSLRKYELIAPGVTKRVRHVLIDLLERDSGWTLPEVWACMRRMPSAVTSALFHSPVSPGARWTSRQQLTDLDANRLGRRLPKKDHFALLVALFREQQVLGNAQKCLELQWALEDAMESRQLRHDKKDERILDFAIESSVMAIAWDRKVLMNNLETMTARLAKSFEKLR